MSNEQNEEPVTIKIRDEFAVHMLNTDGKERAADIAKLFSVFLNNLEAVTGSEGRNMALARTKLEEAAFFAKRAMAVKAENQERGGPKHYPPGMGEESRRLHREYNTLVSAQRNGAQNGPDVVRLTDEAASKRIILVPGGEDL